MAADEYAVTLTLTRDNSVNKILASLEVDAPNPDFNLGDHTLNYEDESVWLSYTNDNHEQVRVGVNPAGNFSVQLLIHEESMELNNNSVITDMECQADEQEGTWNCDWAFTWDLLPQSTSHFQVREGFNFKNK